MTTQLRLYHVPDIRTGTFLSFVHVLSSKYPVLFGIIDATDRKVSRLRMQANLQISSGGCVQIYRELAAHYDIPPCIFSCYKLAWIDHTLGGLHEQLWHEANAYRPYDYRLHRL